MSRIMSIDYGDVRIGIALTDPLKVIASGYRTINNDKNSFQEIYRMSTEMDVETIVIGMPFDADSKIGNAASKVIEFTKKLIAYFDTMNYTVEIYEEDERYTTIDAHRSMKDFGIKNKKKKKFVDQIAAANILKSFMNNRTKSKFNLEKYDESK